MLDAVLARTEYDHRVVSRVRRTITACAPVRNAGAVPASSRILSAVYGMSKAVLVVNHAQIRRKRGYVDIQLGVTLFDLTPHKSRRRPYSVEFLCLQTVCFLDCAPYRQLQRRFKSRLQIAFAHQFEDGTKPMLLIALNWGWILA